MFSPLRSLFCFATITIGAEGLVQKSQSPAKPSSRKSNKKKSHKKKGDSSGSDSEEFLRGDLNKKLVAGTVADATVRSVTHDKSGKIQCKTSTTAEKTESTDSAANPKSPKSNEFLGKLKSVLPSKKVLARLGAAAVGVLGVGLAASGWLNPQKWFNPIPECIPSLDNSRQFCSNQPEPAAPMLKVGGKTTGEKLCCQHTFNADPEDKKYDWTITRECNARLCNSDSAGNGGENHWSQVQGLRKPWYNYFNGEDGMRSEFKHAYTIPDDPDREGSFDLSPGTPTLRAFQEEQDKDTKESKRGDVDPDQPVSRIDFAFNFKDVYKFAQAVKKAKAGGA